MIETSIPTSYLSITVAIILIIGAYMLISTSFFKSTPFRIMGAFVIIVTIILTFITNPDDSTEASDDAYRTALTMQKSNDVLLAYKAKKYIDSEEILTVSESKKLSKMALKKE